jgi:hypothetical protein
MLNSRARFSVSRSVACFITIPIPEALFQQPDTNIWLIFYEPFGEPMK